jgi:D-alanyl-D-alanine carboxypeptidase
MFAVPHNAQGNLLPCIGDDGNCETGPQKGEACCGLGSGISLGLGSGSGISSDTLSDGTVLWGKTGEDMGYHSVVFVTRDLRQIGVVSIGVTDVGAEAFMS